MFRWSSTTLRRSTGRDVLRRFFDITLPQLAEVLTVVVIFRTIWTFNKFEEIYLLTRAAPAPRPSTSRSTRSSSRSATLQMGVGAATGVVMMFLLFGGSLIYMRVFKFAEEDAT